MAFPTKMYFSLSEVSARWHRQTKDVEYCIENGLLNAHIKVCSVKLTSNMLLTKFPHNSQEIYEYRGRADEARYQTKQMQIHTDHLQKSR